MKDDYDLTMGDYPDSVLHVQLIERNTVNGMYNPAWGEDSTFDYMGTDSWLQRRSSRIASLNSSIAVRLTVPGNTTLQAGDMIGTELLDDSLSGKYLVKRLTHSFSRGGKTPKHITTLDCIRDTVKEAFPNSGISRKDEGSSSNTLIPRGSADVTPIQF